MRTAEEIYAAYRIMPNLQLHQLRVAATAKLICDHFVGEIDTNTVVLACLFHDMGNIVKFDLMRFPEFLEPEGFDHWNGVRNEYLERYGAEQHAANHAIAMEIGLPEHVITSLDAVSFSDIERTRDDTSYENKICEYSDLRVGPHGILSMRDRIDDLEVRYKNKFHAVEGEDKLPQLKAAAEEIERLIFAHCSIKPEDINDESAAPIIEELRHYPVA